ncbi:MFS transporter [Nocardia amamiensis]|uniref:MFS transporter n=1 Tax=Nocardia amamiensis TaxID=404578 RepID=A0ABS0D6P5_9NOCA|nr:MFS transporter [Nocardia amamiensis]MBF6302834.1 MFS transporter [Nocardia amamiensis]
MPEPHRRLGYRLTPGFLVFWAGRSVALTGDGMVNVALIFSVVSLGGSAMDIGSVLAVSVVARVALTVLGGILADRLPRRRILLVSDVLQAAVQFSVALVLLCGVGRLWMLLAASIAYSASSAAARTALAGLVPEIVGRDRTGELRQANAMLGMSQSLSRVAGPLLAGVLAAVTSPGCVYAINGASFLVSAVCMASLRLPGRLAGKGGFMLWRELTTGWREIVSRRWYLTGLLVHSVYNLVSAPFFVLGPLLLGGAAVWGVVLAGGAVGGVAGSLLAAWWMPGRPLVVGHLLLIFGAAPLLVLAMGGAASVVGIAAGLGMLATAYVNAVWATVVQSTIPYEVISRVSSYDWLASLVSLPAGYMLAAHLARQAGAGSVLAGSAVLLVAVVIPSAFAGSVRAVRQPDRC